MAQDQSSGAKIIPKCILWMRGLVPFWVLRHSFLSLTDSWWLYNIQLKTSSGVLLLPPSDAYVRSFLYLPYTLIKLYYTKALSDPALSLALDWIRLLRRPRIFSFSNNLSVSLIFFKRSLVFTMLLFSSISLHFLFKKASYLSLLFSGTLHSVGCIFFILPYLSLLFFPQLFVKTSWDNHFAFLHFS